MREFHPFPKIPRYVSDITITEKIDGTNAAVVITEDSDIYAQSRKRVITPDDDNFGFAQWVADHADELSGLGVGVHFGEWWGHGIQRGYGLPKGERRFSLFNVHRWADDDVRPECCHVVPTLYEGVGECEEYTTDQWISRVWRRLYEAGSVAAPGFGDPEGVMIWYHTARQYFKLPFDPTPKGANQ